MKRFDLGMLLDMLTYRRPADSDTESQFIARYLPDTAERDAFGNYHVTIGESPILWSCHTDTVHWNDGRQTISYDAKSGDIRLSKRSRRERSKHSRSNCLGADDTAGVFLLVSLIRASVPGHYVFHYGEEIGGDGSSSLARYAPEIIADSRFAIALDRRGFSDVITHQAFSRCCSEEFADSLARQLNAHGLKYAPSDRGVFTDTANYTGIVGECTNLSVGYLNEHSAQETLNARHLETLLSALSDLDPSALVDDRQPGEDDPLVWHGWANARHTSILERCEYCGHLFETERSTAMDYAKYCSSDCETDDYRDIAARFGSTYLDPVYEDVTRALLQGRDK